MGPGKQLVGIDIGSSSIKVCQTKHSRRGRTLSKFGFAPLPPETIVDGQIRDAARVVGTLRLLFSEAKINQRDVALSVSTQSVIIRKIVVPIMTAGELDEQIRWEAEQHIPFDINDVNIDYQVLRRRPDDKQMDLLLVAARRDQINEYTQLARDAKLRPVVCDVDAFVLQNQFEAVRGLPTETVALLNVGASVTSLNILVDQVSVFTRDIAGGGNAITEAIQVQLGVSPEIAEGYKCQTLVLDPATRERLQPVIATANEGIAAEIQRSIDFFVATSGQAQLARAYLTGGAANAQELAQAIQRRVHVPVEVWSPTENLTINTKEVDPALVQARAAQLGVALGLTLRTAREVRR